MKTIFIIVGGIADVADNELGGKTPLQAASVPSLDALAKCGCCGSVQVLPDEVPATSEAAVLSLLGYDFSRGIPPLDVLADFGGGKPFYPDLLRYFIIPKFSGHGVVITDKDTVRGIGMMAMLRPLFTISPEKAATSAHPCGTLADKAHAAVRAIEMFDFVLVYVDAPAVMSMRGDAEGKIDAIEEIDRELIRPVADYVWNAKLQMNLVVAGDVVASWRKRRMQRGEVPAVVYFNDDLPYDTASFDEETVKEGPLNAPLPGDLIRLLVSFEPYVDEDSAGS